MIAKLILISIIIMNAGNLLFKTGKRDVEAHEIIVGAVTLFIYSILYYFAGIFDPIIGLFK